MDFKFQFLVFLWILAISVFCLLIGRNLIKYIWKEQLWFARRINLKLFLSFLISIIFPVCVTAVFAFLTFQHLFDSLISKADLVGLQNALNEYKREFNQALRKFPRNVNSVSLVKRGLCFVTQSWSYYGNCPRVLLALGRFNLPPVSGLIFLGNYGFMAKRYSSGLALYSIKPTTAQNYSFLVDKISNTRDLLIDRKIILRSLRGNFVFWLVLGIFGALWLGVYLGRNFTNFLADLLKALDDMSRGNLDTRLLQTRPVELAFVSRKFNFMLKALKSSRRSLEARTKELEALLENCGVAVAIFERGKIIYSNLYFESLMTRIEFDTLRRFVDECVQEIKHKFSALPATVSKVMGYRHTIYSLFATLVDQENEKVIISLRDITNLIDAERSLVLKDLVSRIAHEIKNPLMPIEAQLRELVVDQNSRGKLEEVLSRLTNFKRLLFELMSTVKIQNLKVSEFDLIELSLEVANSVRVEEKNIDLVAENHLGDTKVKNDRVIISLALKNVLENAYNFSPANSKIFIRFHEVGNYVCVMVCNKGSQIPDDSRDRIFEPYYSTYPGGSGLGLYLSRVVLNSIKGEIRLVDSTEHQTCFEIKFPRNLDNLISSV
ncbi:MAG: ATP-binding protein [Deltaproteobacteria bacterium]|nr:ATP-binding protein [Deltaproteobacteria bacterium]